jgi:hypothetical protein
MRGRKREVDDKRRLMEKHCVKQRYDRVEKDVN